MTNVGYGLRQLVAELYGLSGVSIKSGCLRPPVY